jgi:hypothetical protein
MQAPCHKHHVIQKQAGTRDKGQRTADGMNTEGSITPDTRLPMVTKSYSTQALTAHTRQDMSLHTHKNPEQPKLLANSHKPCTGTHAPYPTTLHRVSEESCRQQARAEAHPAHPPPPPPSPGRQGPTTTHCHCIIAWSHHCQSLAEVAALTGKLHHTGAPCHPCTMR